MAHLTLENSVNLLPWSIRNWIKHIPVVARIQRWVFARFLANRHFIHTINAGPAKGLKYPVSLPEDKAIWAGTYETKFANALVEAIQPGDVCYDIGGYRGFFSGVFALNGAKQVVIFEPLPDNVAQIQSLIKLNPELPFHLESIAVGDRNDSIEFQVMPEASMGKVSDSPFQAEVKGNKVLELPMRTLDSLVAESKILQPTAIKIDVEGAEVQVLKGSMNIIRQYHPSLFIEAHSRELSRECTSILQELGYTTKVLETGQAPNPEKDPEVCHLIALS